MLNFYWLKNLANQAKISRDGAGKAHGQYLSLQRTHTVVIKLKVTTLLGGNVNCCQICHDMVIEAVKLYIWRVGKFALEKEKAHICAAIEISDMTDPGSETFAEMQDLCTHRCTCVYDAPYISFNEYIVERETEILQKKLNSRFPTEHTPSQSMDFLVPLLREHCYKLKS
ncbi:hypothetical protein QAD02_003837 [Eretmocerus hayati]|uniref:Uncharacterized protein n=1 Tax=Eretmocerus hayati TaxID=131215 RepID=A0ACC2NMZ6_9HYME|nr:hypothetical protein QAD02_003837 [Eretmocerus hayati]